MCSSANSRCSDNTTHSRFHCNCVITLAGCKDHFTIPVWWNWQTAWKYNPHSSVNEIQLALVDVKSRCSAHRIRHWGIIYGENWTTNESLHGCHLFTPGELMAWKHHPPSWPLWVFWRNKLSNKPSSYEDFEKQTYMWHYAWLYHQIRIFYMICINCTWEDNARYCSCCARTSIAAKYIRLLLYLYAWHLDTPAMIRSCWVNEVAQREQTKNINFLIFYYIHNNTKQSKMTR